MKRIHFPRNQKGWTLIELMIVVSIIGIIIPSMVSLFLKVQQGFAADEMRLQLKTANETLMLHLHERLNVSKHMFQNNSTSGGTSFISKIQFSGNTPTTLSLTQLAQAQTCLGGSFSQASSVASAGVSSATAAFFGNCLFYGAYDYTQKVPSVSSSNYLSYPAPLTISGASVTYTDGTLATVVLDIYRFYLEYLSTNNQKPMPNLTTYWLTEWQSVQYADAFEILDIQDQKLQQAVVNYLTNASNFSTTPAAGTTIAFSGNAITMAWDPSQVLITNTATTPNSYAFYKLVSGQAITASGYTTSPEILEQNWTYLSKVSSGILSGGFNYGVPGNTSWTSTSTGNVPFPYVPMYATANGSTGFPGGFEVGISSQASGMQVMIRDIMVANGGYPTTVYDDITTVNNSRDVW